MNALPTYTDSENNVWTIDMRLKQFRKVITPILECGVLTEPSIEFVAFNSEKGRELFKEYCDGQDSYYNEISSEWRRMSMTLEDSEDEDVDDDTLDMIAEDMIKEDKDE